MDVAQLLVELFGRVPPLADQAVAGLDVDRLTEPPSPGANTIAWLIWHLTRIQDHHVATILETDQIWVGNDWSRRFSLEPDPSNTGYRHTADEVAALRPGQPQDLLDYLEAVSAQTRGLLETIAAA